MKRLKNFRSIRGLRNDVIASTDYYTFLKSLLQLNKVYRHRHYFTFLLFLISLLITNITPTNTPEWVVILVAAIAALSAIALLATSVISPYCHKRFVVDIREKLDGYIAEYNNSSKDKLSQLSEAIAIGRARDDVRWTVKFSVMINGLTFLDSNAFYTVATNATLARQDG